MVATSVLAGCGPTTPPDHQAPRANVVEPAQRDPAAQAAAALARDALHHTRFARATLYTWTTADQIEQLRKTGQLLVRDESPASGASYLDQVLFALAQRGEPVATLLYTTTFARMRFAWHAAWATRDGWPREQYGDQLIRITLRPEAVIVSLFTATGTFEARNLRDETVPLASVLANPSQIAAIYFVSDARTAAARGLPRPNATFRELALCNEAMIESWQVGTAELAHELEQEASALDAMASYLRTRPEPPAVNLTSAWAAPVPHPSPEVAYAAALALDSPLYQLEPGRLAALAARLRKTPKPRAFTGGGTATFPGAGIARKPPRIVPRASNTYASSFSRPARPTAAQPVRP
jgi:hypothetical protein